MFRPRGIFLPYSLDIPPQPAPEYLYHRPLFMSIIVLILRRDPSLLTNLAVRNFTVTCMDV